MGDVFGGAPKVSAEAPAEIEEKKRSSAQLRSALLETEGGILGEEVGEVKKRQTLLGN
jgi:hypothetical protein